MGRQVGNVDRDARLVHVKLLLGFFEHVQVAARPQRGHGHGSTLVGRAGALDQRWLANN
jgi:hypothetical protein